MEFALTKMSTKGQIIIPSNLRKDFQAGEEFLVIKENNNLILKRVIELEKSVKEDLEFARRTEKTLKEYEKGKFKSMSEKEFLTELDK